MNSKKKKDREGTRRREECLASLPGFISQLLLLMNSGMILQTAIHRIAEGYGQLPDSRQNTFTRELFRIHRQSLQTGENVVELFYRLGRSSGIKELSRAAGIMKENMDKGTDLWDKLASEGEHLWQEKKRLALEKMRVGESKMSFPLGLLLMSLLLVTAGPAMMQI